MLLIGRAYFDTPIDSYRRALEPFYEVATLDPYQPNALPKSIGLSRLVHRASVARQLLSQALRGDPLAFAETNIKKFAGRFHPRIILVGCVEALRPSVLSAIRRSNPGVLILGVFPDAVSNLGRGHFFAADYDALFFKDHYIVDRFRSKLGWKHAWYLPQACDRQLHRPLPLDERDRKIYGCDITVAGNPYAFRNETLRPLLGYDVKVWGSLPPRWLERPCEGIWTGRYVAGEEKCRAMLAAKIVLNQNHYAEVDGTNKRTFEVAGIGAFQLTDAPALREVFDPETEVAAFEGRSDLLEKVDFFLRNAELRQRMADRAQSRAHEEHTYEHRWVAHLLAVGKSPCAEFPVQPSELKVKAI